MISVSEVLGKLPAQCSALFEPATATPLKNLGSQSDWKLTSKVKIP